MSLQFAALSITNARTLCIGGITTQEAEGARADGYEIDGIGYYLFLANESDPTQPIRVLAKFYSAAEAEECAVALKNKGAQVSN